jgi:hypothetical protein
MFSFEHHVIFINYLLIVGFEVLMAVSTKMTVFWVVALCRLVAITLMMEAVRTSEMLVNLYQSTWRYNPEDGHLHYLLIVMKLTTRKK